MARIALNAVHGISRITLNAIRGLSRTTPDVVRGIVRITPDSNRGIPRTIPVTIRKTTAHPQSTGISPAGVCLVFFEALRESLGMAGD
jgi:hypothetical protein